MGQSPINWGIIIQLWVLGWFVANVFPRILAFCLASLENPGVWVWPSSTGPSRVLVHWDLQNGAATVEDFGTQRLEHCSGCGGLPRIVREVMGAAPQPGWPAGKSVIFWMKHSEIHKIKQKAPKTTVMGAVTHKPSDRAKFKKSRQEKTPTLRHRKVETHHNWM